MNKEKENKYPDGYWPKITYWTNTLSEAIERKDTEVAVKAAEKLKYFTVKQSEVEVVIDKF